MAKSIQLASESELLLPTIERSIPVPVSTWGVFMNRIRHCGDSSSWYQNFGWACVGIAFSLLLTAITYPSGVSWELIVQPPAGSPAGTPVTTLPNITAMVSEICFIVFGLAGAILAAITLWYARDHANNRAELRTIIVDDMETFRLKFEPSSATQSSAA